MNENLLYLKCGQDDTVQGGHGAEPAEFGDGFLSVQGQVEILDGGVGVQQLAHHPLVPGLADALGAAGKTVTAKRRL